MYAKLKTKTSHMRPGSMLTTYFKRSSICAQPNFLAKPQERFKKYF